MTESRDRNNQIILIKLPHQKTFSFLTKLRQSGPKARNETVNRLVWGAAVAVHRVVTIASIKPENRHNRLLRQSEIDNLSVLFGSLSDFNHLLGN